MRFVHAAKLLSALIRWRRRSWHLARHLLDYSWEVAVEGGPTTADQRQSCLMRLCVLEARRPHWIHTGDTSSNDSDLPSLDNSD